MDAVEETFVFTYKRVKPTPLEHALGLTLLFLVLAVVMYVLRWEQIDLEMLMRIFLKLAAQPSLLAFVGLAVLVSWASYSYVGGTTITVDRAGIRMQGPWLSVLGTRKLGWTEIASISYSKPLGTLRLQVRKGLPWVIRARDWTLPDPGAGTAAGDEPDLVQTLARLGAFSANTSAPAGFDEFDLAAHPRTRAALAVLAVLGCYAAVDRFMQTEAWAFFDFRYVLPHAVVALFGAGVLAAWLARLSDAGAVPAQVRTGLVVVSLLVLGPASYMGGIRVNQWLGGPLTPAEYHRSADCLNLIPAEPLLPVIEYTDMARDYWCRIPATQPVQVLVRRGLFGLFQVDLTPQTEAIHRFRDGR